MLYVTEATLARGLQPEPLRCAPAACSEAVVHAVHWLSVLHATVLHWYCSSSSRAAAWCCNGAPRLDPYGFYLDFHHQELLIVSELKCSFLLLCVRMICSKASGSQCHLTRRQQKSLQITWHDNNRQWHSVHDCLSILVYAYVRRADRVDLFLLSLLLCHRLAPVPTPDLAQTFHAVSQMGITDAPPMPTISRHGGV